MQNHFAVILKANRETPALFEGGSSEVVTWLKNQLDVSLFEVFDTQGMRYLSVRNFIATYSVHFVSKFYRMNPETDDLLPNGRALRVGMRVLIDDTKRRINTNVEGGMSDWQYDNALELNRWCTIVGGLEVSLSQTRFIAQYEDGTKRLRVADTSYPWLVKLDSIPESNDRHAALTQMILEAMVDAIRINNNVEDFKAKEARLGAVVQNTAAKIEGRLW